MGPPGNRRAPVRVRVASGFAELRPDPARPQGWVLLVDDVPQSYVDLADPGHLQFPYEKLLGTVLRLWRPDGVRDRVLHLGGGGLTIPRLLAHTRPELAQEVVERDPDIVDLVSRHLPYRGSISMIVGDARAAVECADAAAYGLIVADVFVGAAMPVSVATTGFARAARRALRPGGLLAMNLTDVPPLAHTRIQAATARSVFGDVALFGPEPVLRARRAGNVILLAGTVPAIVADRSERMLRGRDLTIFTAGARPLLDEP